MNDAKSLRHTVWECKYHVVWIPKYRRKALYVELRRHLAGLRQQDRYPAGMVGRREHAPHVH